MQTSVYTPRLTLKETQEAIKTLKDFFERALAEELHLTRVSAPLFVLPESGLNDNLNGVERPVVFDVPAMGGRSCEIIHSLAKWKRMALKRYGFKVGEGLYTDMNAIRRDEELDCLHSLYVDQWDWEKVITKEQRSVEYLRQTVESIYRCFLRTEEHINNRYPHLQRTLPPEITFITTQELADLYPDFSPKEREDAITQDKKAVFLMEIGYPLRCGEPHDGRAPDYDDWYLNGDILFWHPEIEKALELSSMGIRVDKEALLHQVHHAGCTERLELEFHQELLAGNLPDCIGGGIGQSRLCMFFLKCVHIGQVQASVWPEEIVKACARQNIELL